MAQGFNGILRDILPLLQGIPFKHLITSAYFVVDANYTNGISCKKTGRNFKPA